MAAAWLPPDSLGACLLACCDFLIALGCFLVCTWGMGSPGLRHAEPHLAQKMGSVSYVVTIFLNVLSLWISDIRAPPGSRAGSGPWKLYL